MSASLCLQVLGRVLLLEGRRRLTVPSIFCHAPIPQPTAALNGPAMHKPGREAPCSPPTILRHVTGHVMPASAFAWQAALPSQRASERQPASHTPCVVLAEAWEGASQGPGTEMEGPAPNIASQRHLSMLPLAGAWQRQPQAFQPAPGTLGCHAAGHLQHLMRLHLPCRCLAGEGCLHGAGAVTGAGAAPAPCPTTATSSCRPTSGSWCRMPAICSATRPTPTSCWTGRMCCR